MKKKYIETSSVEAMIKNYCKENISKGKRLIDTLDTAVDLLRMLDRLAEENTIFAGNLFNEKEKYDWEHFAAHCTNSEN